jgi:spore coat polysaccharide biosynthesis protein SpsF (cytidylyltransferase family)
VRIVTGVIVVVSLLLPACCVAQAKGVELAQMQQPMDPQFGQQRNKQDPDEVRIEREMAKERNKQRQAQLKADTDKLLKLATELKEYVDKTNENILSVDVLKKTDEIDKLAKSVHDRMKAGNYDFSSAVPSSQ